MTQHNYGIDSRPTASRLVGDVTTAGYPDSTPRVSAVTVVNNILLNLNRQTGLQDEFDSAQDRFD